MITTVVNIKREAYDVYIGRAGNGEDGYFGNPFVLKDPLDRAKILAQFKAYFDKRVQDDAQFKRRVLALRGLKLGCFCKPLACHGDIIAAYINATEGD